MAALQTARPAGERARAPPASAASSAVTARRQRPGRAQPPGGARTASGSACRSAARRQARTRRPAERSRRPFFDIEMLPAGHGDALWIEYGEATARIAWLVDCGTQQTAPALLQRVERLPERRTRARAVRDVAHRRGPHRRRALPFLSAVKEGLRFGDLWFNGWRHLSGQLGCETGRDVLDRDPGSRSCHGTHGASGEAIVVDGGALPVQMLPGGMKLTLLSPRPERTEEVGAGLDARNEALRPRAGLARRLQPLPQRNAIDVDRRRRAGRHDIQRRRRRTERHEHRPARRIRRRQRRCWRRCVCAGAGGVDQAAAARTRSSQRLPVDAFKVAHHGSQNNVSVELLSRSTATAICFRRTAITSVIRTGKRSREFSNTAEQRRRSISTIALATTRCGSGLIYRSAMATPRPTARTIRRAATSRCFPPEGVRDQGFHQLSAR